MFLRLAEPVLYVMAGLHLLGGVLGILLTIHYAGLARIIGEMQLFVLGWTVATRVVGTLMLVALGLVLRRVLPIVDESRTLV